MKFLLARSKDYLLWRIINTTVNTVRAGWPFTTQNQILLNAHLQKICTFIRSKKMVRPKNQDKVVLASTIGAVTPLKVKIIVFFTSEVILKEMVHNTRTIISKFHANAHWLPMPALQMDFAAQYWEPRDIPRLQFNSKKRFKIVNVTLLTEATFMLKWIATRSPSQLSQQLLKCMK